VSDLTSLKSVIDAAYERRAELSARNVPPELDAALAECIALLDSGRARVAEPRAGRWVVNEWLKKAVLLSFRTRDNTPIDAGFTRFYDKVPLKYAAATEEELRAGGARIVPHALVRRGAYIAPNVVLMPSYVNIGAWVGSGTMVDTWATVGSCAQIGRNVHLSGGVGIGGVLEPLQASPTIIEDDCFIGARSEVGDFHGRVPRTEHPHLRPHHRHDPAGARAGRLSRGVGRAAVSGRPLQPLLRGHRQARRRADAREDLHQRSAAQR
jgi:2,3,4,5-tetrahydropyridine-2-carboxylate N-succinyltransferase